MGKIIRKMLSIKIISFLFVTSFLVGVLVNVSTALGPELIVLPSGDMTGVIDAVNIEAALNTVGDSGGTVYLTDGNPSTIDYYYVSNGIFVENFSGTLKGEGMDNTIVEAVRKSEDEGDGFTFTNDSDYWPTSGPTLIWFEDPNGLTVERLTLQVLHPNVTDPYGPLGKTSLMNVFADMGGDSDTTLRYVRVKGAAGENGFGGKNVWVGVHMMRGTRTGLEYAGKGDVAIENCEVENVYYGFSPMWYRDSSIVLGGSPDKKLTAWDSWYPFATWGVKENCKVEISYCNSYNSLEIFTLGVMFDSQAIVKENTATLIGRGRGMRLQRISSSDVRITGNTVSGGNSNQATLLYVEGITIRGNTFKDFYGAGRWWDAPIYVRNNNSGCVISDNEFININGAPAAIFVRGNQNNNNNSLLNNDYRESGLSGLSAQTDGPVCVLLGAGTENNYVNEIGNFSKFPGQSNAMTQVVDLPKEITGITTNRVVGHPANFLAEHINPGIGLRLKELMELSEEEEHKRF